MLESQSSQRVFVSEVGAPDNTTVSPKLSIRGGWSRIAMIPEELWWSWTYTSSSEW